MLTDETAEWLLAGDPAVRWQAKADLLGAPEEDWREDRALVGVGEDWAGRLLGFQDPEGTWGGGIYSPKWKSTTYTLLTLIDCGLSSDNAAARHGAELILESARRGIETDFAGFDLCVVGFYLTIGSTFQPSDPLLPLLVSRVLRQQMDDGGWNCRSSRDRKVRHSSFHTTFNVLPGLRAAACAGILCSHDFKEAEGRALEFMLQHRLYKSDKTGEIVNEKFAKLSYPVRWHYDVLRGLDYMRSLPQLKDPRAQDGLELVASLRRPNGRWPLQNKYAGERFFDMERLGLESRWNTLRALRVLKAAGWAQHLRV
jgi:hypothetical protein